MHGKLHLAPLSEDIQKAIDLGTGTGNFRLIEVSTLLTIGQGFGHLTLVTYTQYCSEPNANTSQADLFPTAEVGHIEHLCDLL